MFVCKRYVLGLETPRDALAPAKADEAREFCFLDPQYRYTKTFLLLADKGAANQNCSFKNVLALRPQIVIAGATQQTI